MRLVLVLALLLAVAPTTAHAQPSDEPDEPAETVEPMRGPWADTLTPGRRDARRLVRLGLVSLLLGLGERQFEFDDPPSVHLERALVRFERARVVLPDDPDLAYYTAYALSRWERPGRDGGTEYRSADALAAWQRVREIDPDYMPARVASSLAMLHARRLEHENAAAEYESALATAIPEAVVLMGRSYPPTMFERELLYMFASVSPANLHGNLAENRMLLGDLPGAIEHYRRAQALVSTPLSRALMDWGLALALNRADQPAESLAAAARAIEADPAAGVPGLERLQHRWGAFAPLHHPEVFFEPTYELHAYHAVGYEAFADRPEVSARTALGAALTSWRRFLAEGGTSSRYAAHARAQVEALEIRIAGLADEEPRGSGPSRPPFLRGGGGARPETLESEETWLPH